MSLENYQQMKYELRLKAMNMSQKKKSKLVKKKLPGVSDSIDSAG